MKNLKNIIIMGVLVIAAIIFTAACSKKVDEIGEVTNNTTNNNSYDYLVLVNKYIKLPSDWEEKVVLKTAKDVHGDDILVEEKALDAYYKLEKDLETEGIDIELDSVYRSVKDQQDLIDEWTNDPTKGKEYVKKFVAVPGYSEHHTGLAIDICLVKDGKIIDDNDDMIAEKEIFKKIHAKLADYGFILRYPEEKEDSTGYTYEPWHFRYIDDINMATVIMNEKMTFEEYLSNYGEVKKLESAEKYQISNLILEKLKDNFGEKMSDVKFDIDKIYTDEEAKELNKDYNEKDILFSVKYQILPADGVDINEFMIPNGELDEESGWIINITRVGLLKYDSKTDSYSLTNLGTGF